MSSSGFIGLAGRPNVGKSTLVNQIVGSHVAIVSMRPQTTRRAIRGIHTDTTAERQLVLVDLPGVQRPRDVLTERMQKRVERELADSDLALIVINGEEGVGPGDRFIARALLGAGAKLPIICAVNKADLDEDEYGVIKAPTLIIWGDEDKWVEPKLADRLVNAIPDGFAAFQLRIGAYTTIAAGHS